MNFYLKNFHLLIIYILDGHNKLQTFFLSTKEVLHPLNEHLWFDHFWFFTVFYQKVFTNAHFTGLKTFQFILFCPAKMLKLTFCVDVVREYILIILCDLIFCDCSFFEVEEVWWFLDLPQTM